jgi:zinc-ribbon domain/Putative zinc-binding metallo-peptidase
MKTFHCVCGELIFFDNISCVVCGRELGFLPDSMVLSSLEPAGEAVFRAGGAGGGLRLYAKCQNYARQSVCNWMIPVATGSVAETAGSPETFCASCRLNQTIPDLSREANQRLWLRMETAKRRLVYTLLNFKLPMASKADDPEQGLAFAFRRVNHQKPAAFFRQSQILLDLGHVLPDLHGIGFLLAALIAFRDHLVRCETRNVLLAETPGEKRAASLARELIIWKGHDHMTRGSKVIDAAKKGRRRQSASRNLS